MIDLENISLFWLIVGGLAAWRITNIIHWEGIAAPFRKLFNGHSQDDGTIHYEHIKVFKWKITFFAELLSCFWCLSVWVSFLTTILILVFPWILIPFAISSIAIIIEKLQESDE
jgi:hypothetical protein